MSKWIVGLLTAAIAVIAFVYVNLDADMRRLLKALPTDTNILFWSIEQRDAGFRTIDRVPLLVKSSPVKAGSKVRELATGAPLKLKIDVEQYMQSQRSAGMVIIHNGVVRLERYGLDFNSTGRWTSFSVAKSFTSTLVGIAIKDGYISSIDDKVSDYISDLKGSVYDDVSIAQLLTMTSGVKWNEDYEDPNSDVAQLNLHVPVEGMDSTVSYMRNLEREAPAGSKWLYKTGETNLIGVLVSAATGKTLSAYLSEKIWVPFGMQQDASWLLGVTGHEISGCCVQAAIRDFARMGLFFLEEGKIAGNAILPPDWIAVATSKQADIGTPGKGYGYQWWTYDDGSYAARGIFGQGIFIDPNRNLVIASNANWPRASMKTTLGAEREAFYRAVQQAIDAENN
ncbi:serine hydrolase domain-containing protein [Planctobacterium marinum]|uniref:Beta-lactamase-related domain-containing protein n=1 Tax=Planctobacterium marinum TaxID=1631968 RepID=A0AA48KR41_9ALTE|nr:hypothetical protein MACH26_26490 [Planctobacterium marinum]